MPVSQNPLVRASKYNSAAQRSLVTKEVPMINMQNTSLITLYPGDVVVLDTTAERSVTITTTAGDPNPFVVVIGGAAGEIIKCAVPGAAVAPVKCDGAVSPGDIIITSTNAGRGKALALEAPTGIIGVALESKGIGDTFAVPVVLASACLGRV